MGLFFFIYLQDKDVEELRELIEGYSNSFWTCSVSKLGYSGTAIISRVFFLINIHSPHAEIYKC